MTRRELQEMAADVSADVHARANAYAAETVKGLTEFDGRVMAIGEHDIARAFVIGFAAGVESLSAMQRRAVRK